MDTNIEVEERSLLSRWLRKLALILGLLLVLLVLAYFVGTSGAFIKGVILPRVSQSLHADITVQDASLSPFSQIVLRKLSVKTASPEPLLAAEEVRARYDLLAILRGNIIVHEVTLLNPDVRIVQEPDGKSNLDPFLGDEDKASRADSKKSLRLAVQNINLKNGHLALLRKDKTGGTQTTELSNLDLSLDRLENNQGGKVTLGGALRMATAIPPGAKGTNDLLEAKLAGTFDFNLNADLLPKDVKGNTRLDLTRTEGAYADFRGLGAVIVADLTPTEMRQAALQFERNGQRLGQVIVSGPFDLAKAEARLKLEIQSIDRQVLNVLGATHGLDFGATTLNASGLVDLSRDWKVIAMNGKLVARQLGVTQRQQSTPPVDLEVDYQAQVNLEDQTALVQKLNLLGRRNQKEFLTGSLDKAMNVTWAPRAKGFAESNFRLALTQLDLAEWGSLLGTNAPSGRADVKLNVLAQKDAKELTTKVSATFSDFTARVGTNRIERALVTLEAENFLEDFKTGDLRNFAFNVQQAGQPVARGSGTAHYDLKTGEGSAQLTADLELPALLRQVPVPGATVSSGAAKVSTAYTHKIEKQTTSGSISLAELTGRYDDYQFNRFQAVLDYNIDLKDSVLQLHRFSVALRQGFETGGSIDLAGKVNLTNQAAQFTFKAAELNQAALNPFLAPSLGDKKLVSISLNGTGSASYDPAGESMLKGEFKIANWLVRDPQQTLPQTPLSLRLQLDGSLNRQVLDLRQCILSMTPTDRAKNEVQLTAKLDLNKTNAKPSQLNLAAESLDLTPYYDLVSGKTNSSTIAQAPSPKAQETEPPAMSLPFEDLTAGVRIDRFYLRQVAISNLLATARLQKGQVTVKPLEMTLNGAPVKGSALLNLAVPGYTYDVSFEADRVPVEPLANSFSSNPAGTFKGNLIASAQIKGAGLTGVNLRKNLTGTVALSVTNVNLEVIGPKAKRILQPIAAVLNISEIIQSPISWVEARASLGQGQINLSKFAALSSAIYAESQGVIPMADVLTNSPLNLPVNLALRRPLAEKANLVPANAPTNTAYVTLPTFAKVTGTIGDPKTQTDKLVIASMVSSSVSKYIPKVGGDAGKILQGVSDVLAGQRGTVPTVNAPTNAPTQPAQPAQPADATSQLIQGLGGLLGGQKRQSKPAGTSAAPNAAPQSNAKTNVNRVDPARQTTPAPKK